MILLDFAAADDAPALLEVYGPYVRDTSVSFETSVPSEAEFRRRIGEISARFPYLVAREGDAVLGYAYAHPFGERAAYDWTVETSIYLRQDCRGRGVGRMLYTALLELLRRQGVHTAAAVITVPNEASFSFHEAMGFTCRGIIPDAGYKLGAWHPVAHFSLALGPAEPCPRPVRRVWDLTDRERTEILLSAARFPRKK